jgi:hypothetical protein
MACSMGQYHRNPLSHLAHGASNRRTYPGSYCSAGWNGQGVGLVSTAALLLPIAPRSRQEHLAFHGNCRQNKEPTSGLEPLTPAPATSLLAHVLVRTGASGACACLGGFLSFGDLALSIVYQCVPARLQYGLQYMGGRQYVLGMSFTASARGWPGGRRACSLETPKELSLGRHDDSVSASSTRSGPPTLFHFPSVVGRVATTRRRGLAASSPLPPLLGRRSRRLGPSHPLA